MKTAINLSLTAGKLSPVEVIPLVAQVGFDGCFWNAAEGVSAADIAKSIREYGLIFQSIHAPFDEIETMWQENAAGDEYLQILKHWVRQCSEAQVPVMVCHVWKGFYEAHPTAVGIDRFGALLQEAESCGVKIAFENTEGEHFLEAIRNQLWASPSAGFCIDTGHELCYNNGEDMIAKYGDKLIATHLNDNLGVTGSTITWKDDAHLFPFDGIADWQSIARRLKNVGFDGILTFELTVKNKPGRNTHDRYAHLTSVELLTLAHEKALQFRSMVV